MPIYFIIFFLLSNGLSLNGMENPSKEFERELIEKPQNLLIQNDTTKGIFLKDIDWLKTIESQGTLEELITKYKAKSNQYPLFLINECTETRCPLNRTAYPNFRDGFENTVADKLTTLFSQKKQGSLVDFASGELFGLTRILAKVLNKQPAISLTVNLIDLEYQPFLNYYGGSAKISDKPQLNFLINSKEKSQDIEKIIVTALRFDQFNNFFKTVAPKSQLHIIAHSTINDYFNYLQKNHLSHADIIIASDMDDIPSLSKQSVFHYQELIARALENNPDLQNYWLVKTQMGINKPGAAIGSYMLAKPSEGQKIEVKIGPKTINLAYTSIDIKD